MWSKGRVKIPYSRVKRGNRFFEPTPRMQAAGFLPRPLGPEGPDSQAKALGLFAEWTAHRTGRAPEQTAPGSLKGEKAEVARRWPAGSIGDGFVRFMRTPEWARLASSTRNREILPSWKYIRDAWGDCDPNAMTLDLLSEWRAELVEERGAGVAHKVFKEWRRHWKVMTALRIARVPDPSLAIRNSAPRGRSEVWREGEVVRLVKAAIRQKDASLACILAICWDSQFSPGDVRTLRKRHLRDDGARLWFDRTAEGRAKTGALAIGTVSKRTARLVRAYLESQPAGLPEALLLRSATGAERHIVPLCHDFAGIREAVFPGDKRQMRDMRRSGAVETFVGGGQAEDVAAKMANGLDRSTTLFKTYNPVSLEAVERADAARAAGRRIIRLKR